MSHKHQFFVHENVWLQSKLQLIEMKKGKEIDAFSAFFIPKKLNFQFKLLAVAAPAHSTLSLRWMSQRWNKKVCVKKKKNDKQIANEIEWKPRWLQRKRKGAHTTTRNFNQIFTVIRLGKDFFSKPYTLLFILYSSFSLSLPFTCAIVCLFVCLLFFLFLFLFFLSFFFSLWERENLNWQLNRFSLAVTKVINRIDSIRQRKM